MKMPKEENEEK